MFPPESDPPMMVRFGIRLGQFRILAKRSGDVGQPPNGHDPDLMRGGVNQSPD
jgi:hypothetical protein